MGSKSVKNPTGKTKPVDKDVPNESPKKASNASMYAPTTGAELTPVSVANHTSTTSPEEENVMIQ